MAGELDFDDIACGEAAALRDEGSRFAKWVSEKKYADMKWLAKSPEVRSNPESILKGAKRVVAALQSYNIKRDETPPTGAARFATYSLFADYHETFGKKIKRLAKNIKESYPGASAYYSVDTGRVLEKGFAIGLGLGFRGRNTALIHPRLGSYCFIGVVFTDADIPLERGKPVELNCGACRLCERACPTGALGKPYILNASKCISYHTIENRGVIPDVIKEKMGNRVFGCEDCYTVCPHNKDAYVPEKPALAQILDPKKLTIEGLLAMSPQDFKKRFGQTPVYRIGYEGLLRNALICAGNSGRKEYFEFIMPHLNSDDLPVQDAAQWAIKKLGITLT